MDEQGNIISDMVRSQIPDLVLVSDDEVSASVTDEEDEEGDTTGTGDDTSGHGSGPDSPTEDAPLHVPTNFSEAFPMSKEAFDNAVATGEINGIEIERIVEKYNGSCRYGFPKLPCKETILTQPRKVAGNIHL